jgi:hypothetical protein
MDKLGDLRIEIKQRRNSLMEPVFQIWPLCGSKSTLSPKLLNNLDSMAVDAVWCEPPSSCISLLTGKFTGDFAIFRASELQNALISWAFEPF